MHCARGNIVDFMLYWFSASQRLIFKVCCKELRLPLWALHAFLNDWCLDIFLFFGPIQVLFLMTTSANGSSFSQKYWNILYSFAGSNSGRLTIVWPSFLIALTDALFLPYPLAETELHSINQSLDLSKLDYNWLINQQIELDLLTLTISMKKQSILKSF